MALDTAIKRASVPGVGRPWSRGVKPDAAHGLPWRYMVGNAYNGSEVLSIWTEQISGASVWTEQLSGQPASGWPEQVSAASTWTEQLSGQPVSGWPEQISAPSTWTEKQ